MIAKQILVQAKAADANERALLVKEHIQASEDIIAKMSPMRLAPGLSNQEREVV